MIDRFIALPPVWKILGIYLVVISILSILVCIYDKVASKTGKVKLRIPEKSLFIWSAAGGGVAMFLCMLIIRHKTAHKQFMIGIPAIILVQAAAVAALIYFKVLPV